MDIHSIHPLRQPEYVNRCGSNRGGCSHLCLPNRSSYTCACPPGLQLITPNGRTCTNQPGELLIFAQKSELRLFPLNVSGEVDHVLPLTGVRSAVALDWDGASKWIYKVFSKSTAIFYRKLSSVLAICLEWKCNFRLLFLIHLLFVFGRSNHFLDRRRVGCHQPSLLERFQPTDACRQRSGIACWYCCFSIFMLPF